MKRVGCLAFIILIGWLAQASAKPKLPEKTVVKVAQINPQVLRKGELFSCQLGKMNVEGQDVYALRMITLDDDGRLVEVECADHKLVRSRLCAEGKVVKVVSRGLRLASFQDQDADSPAELFIYAPTLSSEGTIDVGFKCVDPPPPEVCNGDYNDVLAYR